MFIQLRQLIKQAIHRFFMNGDTFFLQSANNGTNTQRFEPMVIIFHLKLNHSLNLGSFHLTHLQVALHDSFQIINVIEIYVG
ncbi:hypothetical protein D3C74_424020 [compost metagenome]